MSLRNIPDDFRSFARTRARKISTRTVMFATVAIFVALMVGGPLVFFLWGSFWSTEPGFGGHFTFDGYLRLNSPTVFEMLWNTVYISVIGTIATIALSVTLLLALIKTDLPGSEFIKFIVIAQYFLPSYILAFGWTFYADIINELLMGTPFFSAPLLNVYSLWGIIIVGATHYTGLVYLFASGAVESVPADLEEAAIINGASKLATFRKVTLSLALPSLAIATVIVFTRFAQSFGFPLILGLPESIYVIATMMYTLLLGFYPPEFAPAAAMGVILMIVTLVGLALQRSLTGAREKYETIKGGTSRTTMQFRLGWWGPILSVVYTAFVILIFISPLLAIIFASFLTYENILQLNFTGYHLDNYYVLLFGERSEIFWETLSNSLIVSGVGAFFGMVLSSIVSYIIIKGRSGLSPILDFMALAPIAIPGIVVATAFLWIFFTYNIAGLYGTLWLIIIALTSKFIVYGTRATNSSFRAIGEELEEVAELSGANLIGIFRHIFLPLIKPGFVAGYIILFVDYMKVLSIPLFLTENQNVLSTLLFLYIDQQYKQVGAALATIMMVIVAVLYAFTYFILDVEVSRL